MGKWLWGLVYLLLWNVAWAQPYLLEPVASEEFKAGKSVTIQSALDSSGVQDYLLKDLSTMTPVEITLVVEDPSPSLELIAYRADPSRPLRQQKMDSEGVARLQMRTTDSVKLRVQGPPGTAFQMFTWVGPELPLVPEGGETYRFPAWASQPGEAGKATPAPRPPAETKQGSEVLQKAIAALLALILAMLVAIWFRLGRRTAATVTLLSLALPLGNLDRWAWAQPPGQGAGDPAPLVPVTPIRPKPTVVYPSPKPAVRPRPKPTIVGPGERWRKTRRAIERSAERINKFNDAQGILNPGGLLSIIAGLLAQYPLLSAGDITPDLDHKGWPQLPEIVANLEYTKARNEVLRVQGLLEQAYVYRRQGEQDAQKQIAAMQAAGGFHPVVGMAVTHSLQQASGPAEKMYTSYQDAVTKGMNKINRLLVVMAQSERDPYFYPEHCLPYYLFLWQRYNIYTRIM